jgi:hypothetical protein
VTGCVDRRRTRRKTAQGPQIDHMRRPPQHRVDILTDRARTDDASERVHSVGTTARAVGEQRQMGEDSVRPDCDRTVRPCHHHPTLPVDAKRRAAAAAWRAQIGHHAFAPKESVDLPVRPLARPHDLTEVVHRLRSAGLAPQRAEVFDDAVPPQDGMCVAIPCEAEAGDQAAVVDRDDEAVRATRQRTERAGRIRMPPS